MKSALKTRRHLACAAAALALLSWWLAHPVQQAGTPGEPTAPLLDGPEQLPSVSITSVDLVDAKPALRAGWSRSEAAKYLQAYFSRELLRAEIELEQRRYRGQYWETEPGLAELQEVESRREETIRRLTAEMNGLLADACPGESGEPLVVTPFFSLDRPAPNLAFLSAASRQKMEEALLVLARDGSLEADRMMEIAGRSLSGAELVDYTNWNAPASAALRNRLAGFAAGEEEFGALLQWQTAAGSDRETAARLELERRIGSERLAEWETQNDPAVSTALQDLHRLGRPLAQAAWLADFRLQATAQLQQSWGNPWLTDAQKQAEVGLVRNAFRDELAAQLNLPVTDADLLP